MAIFNKSDVKSSSNSTGTTIIANGTKIDGKIEIECNLHIDGQFEGTIKSRKIVTIGKSGVVTGEVIADKLIVSGCFTGNVDAGVVDVLPDGKLFGKILADEFVIERGGFFEGESKTKDALKLKNGKPLELEGKSQ